jgi:hypothetical protein
MFPLCDSDWQWLVRRSAARRQRHPITSLSSSTIPFRHVSARSGSGSCSSLLSNFQPASQSLPLFPLAIHPLLAGPLKVCLLLPLLHISHPLYAFDEDVEIACTHSHASKQANDCDDGRVNLCSILPFICKDGIKLCQYRRRRFQNQRMGNQLDLPLNSIG